MDLVVRIGEMIAYQAYNIKSPLDGEAAMWADLNQHCLPIDKRTLLPSEEGEPLPAAAEAPPPPEAAADAQPPGPAEVSSPSEEPACRPVKPVHRPSARRRWVVLFLLTALLFLGAGVAGFVIYSIATDKGVLVVEIDDPKAEAVLKQEAVVIRDVAGDRKYVLKLGSQELGSGKYEIEVSEAKSGMHFSTREFIIQRDGKVAVRVTLQPPPVATTPPVETKVAEVKPAPPAIRPVPAEPLPAAKPALTPAPEAVKPAQVGEIRPGEAFVELDGSNGFWASAGLPDDVYKKLKEVQSGNKAELKCVAFTPQGDWVILFGRNGCCTSNADLPACKKLRDLERQGCDLKCVAFAPNGGWTVLWDRTGNWTEGDPSRAAFDKMQEVVKNNGQLQSVSFGPNGSWVVSTRRASCAYGSVPDDLAKVLDNAVKSGFAVLCVAFTGRDWICITSGGWWTSNVGLPASNLLDQNCKKGYSPKWIAVNAAPSPLAKHELLYSIPWQDERQGFPANIYQTGISSDGRLFFGAGDAGPTGAIRVFDLATGKQVQELLPGGDLWFTRAQFLPGGKYLVASYSLDKDLYLWDIAANKIVRKFVGHTESGSQFAVSPDGKRLLSWGDDKTVRLWDVETGNELRKLGGPTDKAAGVFSPDGKQVLTFSPDKTLRLWDVETGKELQKLEGHTDACAGCFSPHGNQVLSYSADHTIRLWDLATGKEVRRFGGQTDKVTFAGFVAGGRLVVGHSDDLKYRVWEAASGKPVNEIASAQYGGGDFGLTASPDGRLALGSIIADSSVRVVDLATGKEIHSSDKDQYHARAFSFSPDGTLAVAGSFRNGMHVFRLPPERPAPAKTPAVEEPTKRPSAADALRREDVPAAALAWAGLGDARNAPAELVGILGDARFRLLDMPAFPAYSPDGKLLAVSSGSQVMLVDAETGQYRRTLVGHTGRAFAVAFSPDGRLLAGARHDRIVYLWDVASGREPKALRGHANQVHGAAFSPDGQTLASGDVDGAVKLWDVTSGKEKRSLQLASGIQRLVFFPGGQTLAAAGQGGEVSLWSPATGAKQQTLTTPAPASIRGLTVRADGRMLAASGADGTVRLWDLATATPAGQVWRLFPRYSWVCGVAFSPEGRYLATGNDDGTIRVFRAP